MNKLDLVVLGATGFTGNYVVKNLVNILKKTDNFKFTWGISGRSKEKIQNLLLQLEDIGEDKINVPVLECDVMKDDIREVTRKAKILVNCTGPNTILSESIVRACIETKTHYVDISAELFHIINLYRIFHKSAEDANVLIVPACGFAVVPTATGLMQLEKNFDGDLNTVECYANLMLPKSVYLPIKRDHCLVHYGTWASLVHEFKNRKAYERLKMETFTEQIYTTMPESLKKSIFHKNNGKVWFMYPGPDEDVVDMTQRYLHEKHQKKPFYFKMYTTTPKWYHLICVFVFLLYYMLSSLACFRHLLWKYPGFFSLGYMTRKGPSREMAMDTKFEFALIGKGFDKNNREKSLTVKVSGCDPGYETTSLTLIIAALTILTESDKMPKGVLGVGAAFQDTKIVEHLIKNNGLTYEIIKPK